MIKRQMEPFNNRGIEKVNFFLYDNGEDDDDNGPAWTNFDLSMILGQEPDDEEHQESQFYKIDQTNQVIKKLMKQRAQSGNHKAEYFK